ncbi:hypothetical protein [uncultured Selenomonas sp.]|uniref:hypothetical protein n=1 Tax=uncultured Selenomonas sp. TaxID=159275 RepID=UPI0025D4C7DB|nr:hypothetical protein [uncultured Selenomonas sp.]
MKKHLPFLFFLAVLFAALPCPVQASVPAYVDDECIVYVDDDSISGDWEANRCDATYHVIEDKRIVESIDLHLEFQYQERARQWRYKICAPGIDDAGTSWSPVDAQETPIAYRILNYNLGSGHTDFPYQKKRNKHR